MNFAAVRYQFLIAGIGVLIMAMSAPALAQIVRTEILTFQSMTLEDQQFLSGRKDGKPVTLGGTVPGWVEEASPRLAT